MNIDSALFRAVLGRFASGVTVVTSVSADGEDQGMTVTAFCSLSLEPPLVLICIDRAAAMYESLSTASHFVVNILRDDQELVARRFADPEAERFHGVGYTRGKSGVVILQDALAYLECRRTAEYLEGDHRAYVGLVEHADTVDGAPLVYYRSGYTRIRT